MAVDPMMSEPAAGSSGKSFSDLDELPPLKEPVFTPPVPEPAEPLLPVAQISPRKEKEEKPKIQPREVAKKAIKEISDGSAAADDLFDSGRGGIDSRDCDCGLVSCPLGRRWFHGGSAADESGGIDSGSAGCPDSGCAASGEGSSTGFARCRSSTEPDGTASRKARPKEQSTGSGSGPSRDCPGQALIDSSPQGAQFQIDGKTDPSWVTPFKVASLSPGKHIISVSKSGYASEIRSVDVTAGSTSSLLLRLSPVNALVVVTAHRPAPRSSSMANLPDE